MKNHFLLFSSRVLKVWFLKVFSVGSSYWKEFTCIMLEWGVGFIKRVNLEDFSSRNSWRPTMLWRSKMKSTLLSVKRCKTAENISQQIYFMRTTLQSVDLNRGQHKASRPESISSLYSRCSISIWLLSLISLHTNQAEISSFKF